MNPIHCLVPVFFLTLNSIAAQAETSAGQERPAGTRDGATVFGLLLGRDTLPEVESRVQLQDDSICKIVRSRDECRSTYEIQTLGYLRSSGKDVAISKYSSVGVPESDANVLFAKFSVEGEYLIGTFFKNTLIALSVAGKYSGDNLDSNVDAKALTTSFDKKYKKRAPSLIKTSTQDGITDKYTYQVWQDSTGTFDVHLTRHDSILVNKRACLDNLRDILGMSRDIYNSIKHRCEGSFFSYQLEYRAATLFKEAFDHVRQLEAGAKARKNDAAAQRVNKY